MEIRLLRYFVAVAEELHFGRAAQKLNISQPPLSQQIQMLEKQLGVRLFARTKREVRLTTAGTVFLEEARNVLRQSERAVEIVRRAERGETGQLAISFIDTAIYSIVPPIIQKFSEKYPQVKLFISEERIPVQLQALVEKRIDVGFVQPPVKADELVTESVLREPIILAVPEKHRLANEAKVDLKALAGEPLIQFPRQINQDLYDEIIFLCRQAGFSPNIVQEASPKQTIVGLVAAQIGVSLLPESLQNLQRPGVVYKEITGTAMQLETVAAWRRDNISPTLQAFLEVTRQITKSDKYRS